MIWQKHAPLAESEYKEGIVRHIVPVYELFYNVIIRLEGEHMSHNLNVRQLAVRETLQLRNLPEILKGISPVASVQCYLRLIKIDFQCRF